MSVSTQIATRHFGRKAVASLARKGIRIVGLQSLPDAAGSFLNSETGYVVDDNGTGRVWTYLEVNGRAAA
jgi:hypothetical protein